MKVNFNTTSVCTQLSQARFLSLNSYPLVLSAIFVKFSLLKDWPCRSFVSFEVCFTCSDYLPFTAYYTL